MSHENKKALSPFSHKKYFLIENEYKTRYGCLNSFSIKKNFYDKIELRLFYFRMTKCPLA